DAFERNAITKPDGTLSPTFTLTVSTVPAACQTRMAVCLARTVPVAPMVAVNLPRWTGVVWYVLTALAFLFRLNQKAPAPTAITNSRIRSTRYFFKNFPIATSARVRLANIYANL